MGGLGSISIPMCIPSQLLNPNRRNNFLGKLSHPCLLFHKSHSLSLSSHFSPQNNKVTETHFTLKASASSSSVGAADYTEEPATKVKFQTSLSLPGCSSSLSLLGTVPLEKSLQIVLVRDVDGKTFWDALDEAISPRIKAPTPVDQSALSTFRSIFQGRPLNKGTFIFLTWPDPSKMLVAVSSDGMPASTDATIESANVASALFDVFFGDAPVSPSLKTSVANGLASILK
ncbi:Chalcone-flavanone isomerase family protein isoform 2 [Theobroma cacao]|uniref:Chalcone-flavonone isomerase family protein n=1 Tax=Theobroma cacao TaxID=3641 RepID=A0A061F9B2_THECC|nr:Chalcone-flavanone isomerase family protein isoform 2 [Theobroma cacao]